MDLLYDMTVVLVGAALAFAASLKVQLAAYQPITVSDSGKRACR